MTTLSIVEKQEDGRYIARSIGSQLFAISPMLFTAGSTLAFELAERDASVLPRLLGEIKLYAIGYEVTFWAKLTSIEPCQGVYAGSGLMQRAPAIQAAFTIYGIAERAQVV